MSPENPTTNYAEQMRLERQQVRRDIFLVALDTICHDNQYTIRRLEGTDGADEQQWIEMRFLPLDKNGDSLPEYEFHKFVDKLVATLDSNDYFVTWFEHPTEGQVAKVEIDES